MTDLRIRQYRPTDADAVWALHETALRDIGAFDEEYAHLDADLRSVRETYQAAGGAFLVGELPDRAGGDDGGGDGIVAMGGLQPAPAVDHHADDPAAGVVRRMRVAPTHQRRGFGAAILDGLETQAPELGFDRLLLDTTPDQTAARGLYESFGYAEAHRGSTPAGEMIYYAKVL